MSGRRIRITRDTAIVTFALVFGAYEILYGGGRPSVLVFLGGLIASPLVMRTDEVLRNRQEREQEKE